MDEGGLSLLCPITCQILMACWNCILSHSFIFSFSACSSRASPCPHPKRSRHVAGGPQTWAQAPWDDGRLQTPRRTSAGVLRKNCKRLWINYSVCRRRLFFLGIYRNLHYMYVTMLKCFYCLIFIYIVSPCWRPLIFVSNRKKIPLSFSRFMGELIKYIWTPLWHWLLKAQLTCERKNIHVITQSSVCGSTLVRLDLFILSKRMPWQGDVNNMIDRFDVRAHLDYIPTYTPPLLNTP